MSTSQPLNSQLLPCARHTFSVIAKAHLCLAETNCVFSAADTVELFQLGLLDILCLAPVSDIGARRAAAAVAARTAA